MLWQLGGVFLLSLAFAGAVQAALTLADGRLFSL